MEKWKVFGHLSKMPPVSCSCPPCPWCPFPWSTQAAAPSPALCRGHCLGGKEILEKLMWVILIPFPAGKQRLGAVPKLGTPFFSQFSPRLSQDSSTVSGSHNVLDQTRRLLHSTGSSQSGMSGSDGRTLLAAGTHSSGPAVPPPRLAQLRHLPAGVSPEMPQNLSPFREFSASLPRPFLVLWCF